MIAHKPKVGFVIGGVQKGATTTLHRLLDRHSRLSLAPAKELHFFNKDRYFKWPISVVMKRYYLAYERNFKIQGDGLIFGESTPEYIYCDESPRRVFQYNPEMRWILLLRQPVYRAYSGWNMMRWRKTEGKKLESFSFEESLQAEHERIRTPDGRNQFGYLDRGFYSEQLRRLYRYFPPDQVFVTTTRRLALEQEKVLEGIYQFLGVEPELQDQEIKAHKGNYVGETIERGIFERYTEVMQNDIRETSRLTGIDLGEWLSPDYSESSASV